MCRRDDPIHRELRRIMLENPALVALAKENAALERWFFGQVMRVFHWTANIEEVTIMISREMGREERV